MQILQPIIHETIWGGPKLAKYVETDSTNIGHLYSFIDTKAMKSVFVSGKNKNKDLHTWFLENRDKYGLSRYEELPILGALVEANENLSIQVHPDDKDAQEIEGLPFGKNESFYTLEAPTQGWMYNGCEASSDQEMKEKIASNNINDTLGTMPCEVGDYVYIEGGTLHAATAGSLHFEIEENCNKTYRFFDFDRTDDQGNKRELHLEKALRCLNVTKKSVARKYNDAPIDERMYSTQLVKNKEQFVNSRDIFAFAVMLEGEIDAAEYPIRPGTAVLLEPGEKIDTSNCKFMICWPKA